MSQRAYCPFGQYRTRNAHAWCQARATRKGAPTGLNEDLSHDLWSFLANSGRRLSAHEQCVQDQPSRMVHLNTLITPAHRTGARPYEMMRTFLIAIVALIYVLAVGHAHRVVQGAPVSLAGDGIRVERGN
jgi:hypothetical protein